MHIKFARIDNRLLHGIVLTQYLPSVAPQRVMVIDDEVAADPVKKEMMMLAKPAGSAVSIISAATAMTNMKALKYENQVIFLLTKAPAPVLELLQNGATVGQLMVGATDRLNDGIKLSNRAFITDAELEELRQIKALGTPITVQHNPSVTAVDLWKIVQ